MFFQTYSQSHTYKGNVQDEKGLPVPYVSVYLNNKSVGIISDRSGKFEIDIRKELKTNDSLIFSCLGYKTSILALTVMRLDSGNKITLHSQTYLLDDAVIKYKKYKTKEINYFARNNNNKSLSQSITPSSPGCERATFIPNKNEYKGYIQEVGVFICSHGNPKASFRLQLYDMNPVTNGPGKELIKANVICTATKLDDWSYINLDTLRIKIPEQGFFVGVEPLAYTGYTPMFPDSTSLIEWDSIVRQISLNISNGIYPNELFFGSAFVNNAINKKGIHEWEKQLKYWDKWLPIGVNYKTIHGFCSVMPVKAKISYYSKNNKKDDDALTIDTAAAIDYEKINNRTLKKIFTDLPEYDDIKYPHSSIKEFFESNIKAVKANDFTYLFVYLYLTTEEEKQEYLKGLTDLSKNKQPFTEEDKQNGIDFFNKCLSKIEELKLTKLCDDTYELEVDDGQAVQFIKKKDKWYAYPYIIHVNSENVRKSLYKKL